MAFVVFVFRATTGITLVFAIACFSYLGYSALMLA
jgi:hypothetical protein